MASGVSSVGFSTTLLPATKAGPSLRPARARGKFQAVMATTTPLGTLCIQICSSALSEGTMSPSIIRAQSHAYSIKVAVTSTSILATLMSLPCSRTSRVASCSLQARTPWAKALMMLARWRGGTLRHSFWAFWAASRAFSASPAVPSAIWPTMVSSVGLVTGKYSPPVGATHSPSMNNSCWIGFGISVLAIIGLWPRRPMG